MKKLLSIIILSAAACTLSFGQTIDENWEFTHLFASDDSLGTTHLYYKIQKTREFYCEREYQKGIFTTSENRLRHLNYSAEIDTTLLWVRRNIPPTECTGGGGFHIYDFHPFDGNPENAIFAGMYADGVHPFGYVQVGSRDFYLQVMIGSFDRLFANPHIGDTFFLPEYDRTIEVPLTEDQDTLRVINDYWHEIGYTDSLLNYVNVHEFQLLGLSRFNDSLAFYQKEGDIYRSENLGQTEEQLNINFPTGSEFSFDADSLHIYLTSNSNSFQLSDQYGKPGSWSSGALPVNSRFFLADPYIPGLVILADTNKIYRSTDHAENFELLFEFERQIHGLYKKPGEDILYAILPDQILKIESGEIEVIKETPSKKTMSFTQDTFPYRSGDKFVFRIYQREGNVSTPVEDFKAIVTEEITTPENEKRILFENSSERPLFSELLFDSNNDLRINQGFATNSQFVLKNNQQQYEPWVAISETDSIPLLGIYREIGRGFNFGEEITNTNIDFFTPEEPDTTARLGDQNLSIRWSDTFGFTSVYHWEENLRYVLRGAVINEVVYGDTTLPLSVFNEITQDIPVQPELHQNYPNPFNPTTTISYQIPENKHVSLEIFDLLGRRVALLADGIKPAGFHQVEFDASGYASGLYIYRLRAGDIIKSRQMILMK